MEENFMINGLFSVIIPAYNREKTIARTIKSIFNQTYDNYEIIVINDGSRDLTEKVVMEFEDKRLRYFWQQNSGAQRARNYGLQKALGEYVIFLDSDDELLPNCLEKMVKEYESDLTVGSVYCQTGRRNVNGSIEQVRKDRLSGYIYKEVLTQGYLTSSSFISMRKSVFDTVENWDEQFPASQDDDMCFKISKVFKINLIDEILGLYGTDAGPGQQIGSSKKRVATGWFILWTKYEDEVLSVCGRDVIAQHFTECAYRFANIGDKTYKTCLNKVKEYSSTPNYYKVIGTVCLMLIKFKIRLLLGGK